MLKDKKTKDGAVRMPLAKRIGSVSLPVAVPTSQLQRAIEFLKVYGS